MPLDPQAKVILEAMSAGLPFEPDLDIDEFRTQFSETSLPLEAVSIAKAEDRSIPGPQGEIPIRIYTPEGDGPHPLVVYFHGGGWVIFQKTLTKY